MNDIESEKRKYWASSMDAAAAFMIKARDVEIQENWEPLESLPDAAEEAHVEVLFSDRPTAGGVERQFYLRRGLMPMYIATAKELNDRGWNLKIEDAYRTPATQKELQRTPDLFDTVVNVVLWETKGVIPDSEFVFQRLLALIAFCPIVGTHVSGSAMDVSVYDRKTGSEIDRGAPYMEFSAMTPMKSPFISDEARTNRQEITQIMKRHGFIDYPWEFWHYNQRDSFDVVLSGDPSRGVYGPVEWDSDQHIPTPVANPKERLNSEMDIREMMEAAIERRKKRQL